MDLSEWILLIFVATFLLLMLGGVVAWIAQLRRGHRRSRGNHKARNRKS